MTVRFVTIIAIAFFLSAVSARANLVGNPGLSAIASGIAGESVSVNVDADPSTWASESAAIGGSDMTLGYSIGNEVILGPAVVSGLAAIHNGQVSTSSLYNVAVAVMTLTHESYHIKLHSLDEGRVNACALQAFPQVIQTYFGVTPTVSKTITVTSLHKHRVRIHGRWVTQARVVHRRIVSTVANYVYSELLSYSQAFYASQPAPYSTGTCS